MGAAIPLLMKTPRSCHLFMPPKASPGPILVPMPCDDLRKYRRDRATRQSPEVGILASNEVWSALRLGRRRERGGICGRRGRRVGGVGGANRVRVDGRLLVGGRLDRRGRIDAGAVGRLGRVGGRRGGRRSRGLRLARRAGLVVRGAAGRRAAGLRVAGGRRFVAGVGRARLGRLARLAGPAPRALVARGRAGGRLLRRVVFGAGARRAALRLGVARVALPDRAVVAPVLRRARRLVVAGATAGVFGRRARGGARIGRAGGRG